MLTPFAGLDRSISFLMRPRSGPRFFVAGGDLTGVHLLRNQPEPRPGFYHIGGGGIVLEEAMIRTLGETAERYAQFVSELRFGSQLRFATQQELFDSGERVIGESELTFYSENQRRKPGFPFQPFSPHAPMSWLRVPFDDGERYWVPAQLLLVGYVIRKDRGEPWLTTAVTTGTAAHVDPILAQRGAILELIQLDASMGHWYSASAAPEILFDERTASIEALIARQFEGATPRPSFYFMPSPDLPGLTVTCILRDREHIPHVAIGQACDTRLERAMYKALLEAVGVLHLARVTVLEQGYGVAPGAEKRIDSSRISDLDSNVAWYALGENREQLDRKFARQAVRASELPPDSTLTPREELRMLVDGFRSAKKRLAFLELTTDDVRSLGFRVFRVWSPDTLSLSLPSFPQARHRRYRDYGGIAHVEPHPYP